MEQDNRINQPQDNNDMKDVVIPVIQEQLTIEKEMIETGKVYVRKRVTEEPADLKIPLMHEGYDIRKVAINKIVDTPPSVRHEGDTTIIPIVHEVLIIEKRYEVVEELHIVKTKENVPFKQQFTLLHEHVEVERVPIEKTNNNQQ